MNGADRALNAAAHRHSLSPAGRPCRMALGAPGHRPPSPRARLHHPRRSRRPRARRARPTHRRLPLHENQAGGWGQRFFTPAVEKAALQPELFAILGATPYSLRRGGISLRLRAEDPQTVASECGTSLRRSQALRLRDEDLRRNGRRPTDTEWVPHVPNKPTPSARKPAQRARRQRQSAPSRQDPQLARHHRRRRRGRKPPSPIKSAA